MSPLNAVEAESTGSVSVLTAELVTDIKGDELPPGLVIATAYYLGPQTQFRGELVPTGSRLLTVS